MSNIFYDTEFVENGVTIDLVSIGMVAERNELYAIVADDQLIQRVAEHPWLTMNVLPHLPVKVVRNLDSIYHDHDGNRWHPVKYWEWDEAHPDFACVLPRKAIAAQVRSFILEHASPRLWAYYGAYDHVCLAQLYGRMLDLPHGVPMFTNEFMQEWHRAGQPPLPPKPKDAHNALADAQWLALAHTLLMNP